MASIHLNLGTIINSYHLNFSSFKVAGQMASMSRFPSIGIQSKKASKNYEMQTSVCLNRDR